MSSVVTHTGAAVPITSITGQVPVPSSPKKVTLSPSKVVAYMVQGTGAIMCLDVIAWPLEVARTRMQASKDNRHQSTFKLLRDIARTEGPTKLFRGLGPFLLTSLPSHAIYLGVYEHATSVLEQTFPEHPSNNSVLREIAVAGTAGFIAESISACLYVPTDVISQRLRVQSELKGGGATHLTSIDIFKSIYKTDGIRGYYQGFGANLIAFTPWSVTHWAAYEATKKGLYNFFRAKEQKEATAAVRKGVGLELEEGFYQRNQFSQHTNLLVGLSAFNAAILSLVVSSPFDMIRVRLQLLDTSHVKEAEQLAKGWWSMAKLIAKEEGVRGFFKGMTPKMLSSLPGCVGFLFVYENIKSRLDD